MPDTPRLRDHVLIRTYKLDDDRLRVTLEGVESRHFVESECEAQTFPLFVAIIRLWLGAVGHRDHWFERWLMFSEMVYAGARAGMPFGRKSRNRAKVASRRAPVPAVDLSRSSPQADD